MATAIRTDFGDEILDHQSWLMALAMRFTRRRCDAEDLVQETVAKALRCAHQFEPGTNLRAWLSSIMRTLFFTEVKKRTREPVFDLRDTRCIGPSQEWAVYWRSVSDFIDSNIAEEKREALMRIIDGESYKEAADHMGCRVGTVKSRVSRARATLMDNFEMP
jgi:RNA polymerase sigma-70 factor (ECF subfamily)